MKFIPIGDRVLVQLDVASGKTRSGIYVPESAAHSMTGIVVAVGAGVKCKALVPGARVHMTRFAGATADEIEPGVICTQEMHLAGVYSSGRRSRKK